ncbi:MAG: hypothetical protein ACRDBP_13145, partial [Luteolibacter sp.]
AREVERKANALFSKLRVSASGTADPAAVVALNLPARLSALATLADAYQLQLRLFPERTLESPEGLPYNAALQVLAEGIEPALAASRAAAIAKGDFSAVQLALKQQIEFSNSFRTLTGAAPLFDPAILDLMEVSVTALKTAIQSTPPRKRQALVTEHLQMLGSIVAVSELSSTGLFLSALLDDLSNSGDQFRALVYNSVDCDELLQALKASTAIPFKSLRPNNHPLADGAASQLAISGTYESTGSHGGKSYTLQLNRAGQYLLGRMQEHEPRRRTRSWELEGLLFGSETAATVRFSCLRFTGSSGVKSVLLEAQPTVDGMNVSVITSPEGQVVNFRRTSNRPFYSAQFSSRMNNEVRSVFDASIRAPLHQDQLTRVAVNINELHFALLEWDQFRNDSSIAVRRGIADAIDSACTRLLSDVSRDQIPLVRQFTRSRLSGVSERPKAGTTPTTPLAQRLLRVETGQKTQWTLLLEIFRDRSTLVKPDVTGDDVLTSCAQLLTGEPPPLVGAPVYTYKCQINKTSIPFVPPGFITLEIKRELNGVVEETFFLSGAFLQAGAGVPLGKIASFLGKLEDLESGGTGGDDVKVTSHVRYTEVDLAGPILLGSAGGMSTTFGLGTTPGNRELAVSAGIGAITLAGPLSVNKPPLILPLPLFSTSQEIGIGLEAAIGVGGIKSNSAFNGEVDIFSSRLEPLKGPPRRNFELGQQAVFATGSSDLTDCGWVQLRQFVAEYRAIFDDPAAKITLIGLTDTVGSDAGNLALSQNRNLSVFAALTRILGRAPGSVDSPVRILSLGEQPARSDLPLPTGLNTTETALLQELRKPTVLGTLPSGSPQSVPGWRVVKVLLNNTIFFDLNAL